MKATAIVSLIGVSDLTRVAQEQRASTGQTVAAFTGVLIAYFLDRPAADRGNAAPGTPRQPAAGRPVATGFLALLRPPPATATGGGRR